MSSSSFSSMFDYNPATTVLCLAYTGDYLFAGTGNNGILLRSATGSFWENFYAIEDISITALYAFKNKLYVGSSPNGKIYMTDLSNNATVFSQQIGGNISAFVSYKNSIYVSNNISGVYQYNTLTNAWDLFYEPYGIIYKMKVIGDKLYFAMNQGNLVVYDGINMELVTIK